MAHRKVGERLAELQDYPAALQVGGDPAWAHPCYTSPPRPTPRGAPFLRRDAQSPLLRLLARGDGGGARPGFGLPWGFGGTLLGKGGDPLKLEEHVAFA